MAKKMPAQEKLDEMLIGEGIAQGYHRVLDYLSEKYLSTDLKEPQSAEGMAVLLLAREIVEAIQTGKLSKLP